MSSTNITDVRRVGTALVATFAKAGPPVIWRIDLDSNPHFTMALQGEGESWEFGITTPTGEFQYVASFSSRKDADEAFGLVAETLSEGRFDWVIFVLKLLGIALLTLIVFQLAWGWFSRPPLPHLAAETAPAIRTAVPEAQPEPESAPPDQPSIAQPPPKLNGVPLPADEVLTPPDEN